MAERSNQRLVAIDKRRVCFDHTSTDDHGPLVIVLERIRDRVGILEKAVVRIERSEITIASKPSQSIFGFADVAIGRGT